MAEYLHHVSGFFAYREHAERTLSKIVSLGIPHQQLQLFASNNSEPDSAPIEDSNTVLKDILVDGATGMAIGTGLGALAQVALVATNVSPFITPLVMMGWGASIGGVLGAAAGAMYNNPESPTGEEDGWLSSLVRDAIASGQTVLIVQTRTEQETKTARGIIRDAVGDFEDKSID